jgi:Fic family protein
VLALNSERLTATDVPIGTAWLLGACMEARGKQELWLRQQPETLAALREQAIIQSVESSNRIEGVTVASGRLRPIALGKAKPRDRPEEELAGYRRALDWIFARRAPPAMTPKVIRRLHALAQGGSTGDAGDWKVRDNEIVEILPNGERRVHFTPTSARETPQAMDGLCRSYRETLDDGRAPPLLVAATFVFDLLCIHPFRDGNGRASRLATTLLLEEHGFLVARYVSLERLVEERKDEYYGVLHACSQGWHEGRNEIAPWWNFFLGVLRSGYRDLEQQVEAASGRPAKSDWVRRTVLDQTGRFTLADLVQELPAVSPQLIKKVLAQMKSEGTVLLRGRGRGASWERNAEG